MSLSKKLQAYARCVRLDKPIGTLLLLWPTLTALWVAHAQTPPFSLILIFTLGTFFTRSAGCALNDWADRHIDAHVTRTVHRPLATQAIRPLEAIFLFVLFGLAALVTAWPLPKACWFWVFTAILTMTLYPFTKRFLKAPQAFLGLTFSIGIPIAFCTHTPMLPPIAWILFIGNLCMVIAYDTYYAMVDLEDDENLAIHSTAKWFGKHARGIILFLQACYLASFVLLGVSLPANSVYWIFWGMSALLCLKQFQVTRTLDKNQLFSAFKNNHLVGFYLFLGTLLQFI